MATVNNYSGELIFDDKDRFIASEELIRLFTGLPSTPYIVTFSDAKGKTASKLSDASRVYMLSDMSDLPNRKWCVFAINISNTEWTIDEAYGLETVDSAARSFEDRYAYFTFNNLVTKMWGSLTVEKLLSPLLIKEQYSTGKIDYITKNYTRGVIDKSR
jgi:hypothetical protein